MYYTNMKGGANLGPVARASPLVLKVLGPAPINKDCGRPQLPAMLYGPCQGAGNQECNKDLSSSELKASAISVIAASPQIVAGSDTPKANSPGEIS